MSSYIYTGVLNVNKTMAIEAFLNTIREKLLRDRLQLNDNTGFFMFKQ
jgi:hypothetical protein